MSLPVERLDEHVNGPAAGEPDGERLVVGVAEGDDAALVRTREHGQRLLDDCTLDAAARDRPGDLAGVAHGHRGARVTGAGTLDADDTSHRDLVAGRTPPLDVVQHFLHFAMTSASCSKEASEWPSTNSSTCGSAATMPPARGAKPGDAFNGLTHTMRCA